MNEKTTHAQRRRLEARQGARLKLRAGQYIRRLKEIAEKAENAEPSKIPALRLKADIYARLLAKCLPDLKAVEHSGEINHAHRMTDVELDQRIAEIQARIAVAAGGAATSH